MILLDTNALLWLHTGHRRARPLLRNRSSLYASPVSLLEVQMLLEAGRVRLREGARLSELADDPRWALDDVGTVALVDAAFAVSWTRDPFDRLLVAHSTLRRWKLATADAHLLEHLPSGAVIEL